MALSETLIVNQALSLIGAKRINNIETDTSVEAIHTRQQYEQTRDALLRAFEWPFALARATLSEDTDTPEFEWEHQFHLPQDFLRLVRYYTDSENPSNRFSMEGNMILSNDTEVQIKYVSKIIDVTKFDKLFVDCLVYQLALKMLHPVAGTNALQLRQFLLSELGQLMAHARTVAKQEANTTGYSAWRMARYTNSTNQGI
jgi:hypothetical protein